MTVLLAAVERAPDIAAVVLKDLVYTEDESPSGERFWTIWQRCANVALENQAIRGPSRVVGYSEQRKLIRTFLFTESQWKEGLKAWKPLESHRDFVQQAFMQVGDTPAGFAALVQMLQTVAGFLLPDALVNLDEARSRCSNEPLLENESARVELELLLRDCVLSMGSQLRSREVVRNAALNLLDHLVNEGSSLAFQLREFMVAPARTAHISREEHQGV